MGAAWIRREILVSQTAEVIGYKAGLALTRKEFDEIIPKEYKDLWNGHDQEILRVCSEEFDGLISKLLYAVGNISSPDLMPTVSVTKKFLKSPDLFPLYSEVHREWYEFLKRSMDHGNAHLDNRIDPTPFFESIEAKHGLPGVFMALEIMKAMNTQLHISPFSRVRSMDWKDTAELESLFKSRSLETQYGTFFDQRFIDYLGQNFERIGDIHWRKFEALTCEFFDRQGYYVEIGPGGNDNNIDARTWKKDPVAGGPPTILIQCKRRKEKVDKVVIKALYADILHENAEKGLIVTSQTLSPGADEVRTARGYPIEKADRSTLKKWIEVMRSPGTGIFMH